ncbi:DNA polymerase III subunit delta' [Streptococcus sp. X16XC17]|uniref:DNA polymerase III subunit delta' n=1 Tax=Streptococcus sp. X16XC17 TaxID=2316646 RepID=UPI001038B8FE|nr:DNA polymerase III subunit delta' [Streptococcus sp. X16XC17]TCD46633.1 DNA polymerase III subunit delta' [Streptococcus sp. X16XC17]
MKKYPLEELRPDLLDRLKRILENDRLGHAYLFSGDFASFEMAIFLTQAIFCQEKAGALPCGQCRNCRLIAQQEFPDLTIIAPQGNVIKTDTVRELVKDFSQSGFESNKQVFIIRDAEKMHPNAANSLLKAMEEPQSDIHIFLLTNQEEAVLPTIKSRAQLVLFPKNTHFLEQKLEEEGLLKNQARLVAQVAGNVEQALLLAQNKAFIDSLTQSRKLVDSLYQSQNQAYLQVGKLVALASEKSEQERLFDVLTIILAEQLEEKVARHYLDGLLLARKMWRSNVSFQNSLEHWILAA